MDLGTSGTHELGNHNEQQQHQYPQQTSSAATTLPLSPLRPAPMGGASMLHAASNYYSTTPPSSLMQQPHHDLASATKSNMAKVITTHAPSGNGLGNSTAMPQAVKSNDLHKTSDQVVTDQAREILRQAVVTAVTESNHAAKLQQQAAVAVAGANNNVKSKVTGAVRYRECMKNHAASIGGHAIDGCGEFMSGGDDDALRCAACDCHRNFHRREVEGELQCDCKRKPKNMVTSNANNNNNHQHQNASLQPSNATPGTTLVLTGGGGGQMTPLTMAAAMSAGGPTDSDDQDDGPGHIVTSGGMMSMSMRSPSAIKKRFRTKFTTEQKDKMLAFAEKVGWRIQKHDEAAVHEFCATVGVKRHVLKVWMHNNKHTMGKKP